jgi:acetyltransferase-like isoleucine patch superfamily enzyme
MFYLALIYCMPALVWMWLYKLGSGWTWRLGWAFAGPAVYGIGFVLVAGVLSKQHQHAIIAGRFPRDMGNPIYFHRRLYGLCWTALFYCKPLYALCLAAPWLKWLTFRLFGYRGRMNFTVYPDTWIRDLPLLRFGQGAYVSNRATLGTNIALANGQILVDRIELGDGALVGHLAMLAPGVRLGLRAEVAVGCAIGIGSVIGAGAKVLPTAALEHGVVVCARATIGPMSFIGSKSVINEGIHLAGGSLLARRSVVSNRQDASTCVSSATHHSDKGPRQETSHDE